MRLTDLDALFLDCGGTLITPTDGVGGRYAAVARNLGVHAPASLVTDRFLATFARARARARAEGRLAYGRTHDEARAFWSAIVHEVFSPWSTEPAVTEAVFEALFEHFARAEAWELYPDVPPLLDAAQAAGVPVVMVSNWDARLLEVVAAMGLAPHFRHVVGSFAVGAEKPSPAIFEAALALTGEVRRDRVLHIGDSSSEDVAGAHAAGLLALHLDRDGRHPDEPLRIRSLAETERALTRIAATARS
jgi:putative hydrolase of the HAD superfamily